MINTTFRRMMALCMAVAITIGVAGVTVSGQDTDPNFDEMQLQRSENPTQLVDGEGLEQLEANCLQCHTAQPILTHDGFTPEIWASEVEKMRTTYGAEITDEDAAIITAYLAWYYSDEPVSAENQLLNGLNTEEEDPTFPDDQATPVPDPEGTPITDPAE